MDMRGAIFDFDGTLFDSMFIWDTIASDYLRTLGIAPSADVNQKFKTMSLPEAARYYQTQYGVALSTEKIMEGVNRQAEAMYRTRVLLKPGVRGCLEKLRMHNVHMAIATASDVELVAMVLEKHQVSEYFSDVVSCTQVGAGKTKPTVYECAMKKLGTTKENTVVFEDSLYAIRTAKAAGFCVFGVQDAYEPNQEGVHRESDLYITDFADFAERLTIG